MTEPSKPPSQAENEFLAQAGHEKQSGLVAEFVSFMKENKVWWMAPILIVLGLVGLLLVLGTTGAAPFLYTLW
jgi:hypothetical protein